jgi:hypothetical protein
MTTPHLSGDRDGVTFERARDGARLNRQALAVFEFMSDGKWHTLSEIHHATGEPEASISARLRDFRRPQFGSHTVEREYIMNGLWRYRLVLPRGQLELL